MLPLHRCRGGRSGWSRPLRCARPGGCPAPLGGAAFGWTFAVVLLAVHRLHVFALVPVWLTVLLQAALVAIMAAYSAALCFVANHASDGGMTRDYWRPAGAGVRRLRGGYSPVPWLSLVTRSLIHRSPDGRRCSAFTGDLGAAVAAAQGFTRWSPGPRRAPNPRAAAARRPQPVRPRSLRSPSCSWRRRLPRAVSGPIRPARRFPSPPCRAPSRRTGNGRSTIARSPWCATRRSPIKHGVRA